MKLALQVDNTPNSRRPHLRGSRSRALKKTRLCATEVPNPLSTTVRKPTLAQKIKIKWILIQTKKTQSTFPSSTKEMAENEKLSATNSKQWSPRTKSK